MLTRALALLFGTVLIGCAPAAVDEEGEVDSSIIGGMLDHDDPAVVAIWGRPAGATLGTLCTGTVIGPRTILTAGHCVSPSAIGANPLFTVYTGTYYQQATSVLAVASAVAHPDFDLAKEEDGFGVDIGILHLAKATTIKPIPFNTDPLTSSFSAASVRLVGYGANSHRDTGREFKRTVTVNVDSYNQRLIHVGSANKAACHGDSGGPLLMPVDGVPQTFGVDSLVYDNSDTDVCLRGSWYTRVDTHADFIRSQLR
jgi:secreted trypsin-like serine protease